MVDLECLAHFGKAVIQQTYSISIPCYEEKRRPGFEGGEHVDRWSGIFPHSSLFSLQCPIQYTSNTGKRLTQTEIAPA